MPATHRTAQCCPKFTLTEVLLRDKVQSDSVPEFISEARAILTILLDLSTIKVEARLYDDGDVHAAIMLAASLLETAEELSGKEFK